MFGSNCEVASEIFFTTKNPLLHKKALFLSCCKINQNMEFGDIIYLLLLLFFMILGFFNDSRKKKRQQEQQSQMPPRPNVEHSPRPFIEEFDTLEEVTPPEWFEPRPEPNITPSRTFSSAQQREKERPVFQSSLDLATDFSKQSSLKSSIFVFDAESSYDFESDSIDISAMLVSYKEKDSEETMKEIRGSSFHPLIKGLLGDAGNDELKKGVIYGEIMQRRF